MADTTTPAANLDVVGAQETGRESSLSTWAGPYVTEMLGRGRAIASEPYQAYTGQLTAGTSPIQQQAFQGIGSLAIPTESMGAFTPESITTPGMAQQYMNPYLQASLEPQIAEARRQAEISRMADAARLTQAGAYGGTRQAVMESEGQRNLLRNLADITGTGYAQAYQLAQQQFNTEQERQRAAQEAANVYGLGALQRQAELGAAQRAVEQEGIAAQRAQFEEERDFPYKQVQYMQSLLQGLPISAQNISYEEGSFMDKILAGGESAMQLGDFISNLFGSGE